MPITKEQKCLYEIIKVLSKHGFYPSQKPLDPKKISKEEHSMKKLKRIFGILKDLTEEKAERKYQSLVGFLRVEPKQHPQPFQTLGEILKLLGNQEDINTSNAENKIKEVITFLNR